MSDCTNEVECCTAGPFVVTTTDVEPPPVIPTVYYNTEQSYTATCPEGQVGDPVTVTIAAATYSNTTSQASIDAYALAQATAQAEAALTCSIAAQLSGLMWELPCTWGGDAPGTCPCENPAPQEVILSGAPGTTYNVVLRIRGVIETKDYTGGTTPTQSDTYCKADATYAVGDPYNVYELWVSDPLHRYFLNASSVVHTLGNIWTPDYTLTVQMKTGATVRLTADNRDTNEVTNGTHLSVGGEPPALGVTEPYNGQFLQMDVVSVTAV